MSSVAVPSFWLFPSLLPSMLPSFLFPPFLLPLPPSLSSLPPFLPLSLSLFISLSLPPFLLPFLCPFLPYETLKNSNQQQRTESLDLGFTVPLTPVQVSSCRTGILLGLLPRQFRISSLDFPPFCGPRRKPNEGFWVSVYSSCPLTLAMTSGESG